MYYKYPIIKMAFDEKIQIMEKDTLHYKVNNYKHTGIYYENI